MKVYMISLPEDGARRSRMRDQFADIYDSFEIVDGVRIRDGKQALIGRGVRSLDERLTLPEIGCALSHLAVLKNFLESGEPNCLILEDDVIGTSEHIRSIKETMARLPVDAFLLCGGQEGLRGEIYNYGRRSGIPGVYFIPKYVRKFYTRACCYAVTRASAQELIRVQKEKLGVSDNWGKYFYRWDSFYFTGRIAHPTDLQSSKIEHERQENKPRSELARIRNDGLMYVLSRFGTKLLLSNFAQTLKLERVR